MEKKKPLLMLIDGYGLIFRAYYTIRPMTYGTMKAPIANKPSKNLAFHLPAVTFSSFTNLLLHVVVLSCVMIYQRLPSSF